MLRSTFYRKGDIKNIKCMGLGDACLQDPINVARVLSVGLTSSASSVRGRVSNAM